MIHTSNKIVSIIVVTSGIRDYLRSCLDSIKEQTDYILEILVIDNSLNPNFSQVISKNYPGIRLYPSSKNLFYCESLNKGIKISKGEFILCLNDDVTLDRIFIEKALKGFSINEKIGLVSGKILRQDRQTIDSTGLFLSLWRTAQERGYGIKDGGKYEKEGYVFGVTGAAAFFRKEMLEQIKTNSDYFDPDFHIFYEDLDIAWRAHKLGWRGYYMPSALAYHVRGATVRQNKGVNKKYARHYLNDELHSCLIKNRYLAMIKNESLAGLLLHLPFIAFYDFMMWSYVLLFRPQMVKKFILNLGYLNSAFRQRMRRA